MARPWQLRHKLVIGLLLVMLSIALLMTGAFLGFSSYVEAGRITDHKLHQMQVVVILRDQIHTMADNQKGPDGRPLTRQEQQQFILHWYQEASKSLAYYQETLATDQQLRLRDPDDGEGQRHAILRIEQALVQLKTAITTLGTQIDTRGDQRLIDDPPVRAAYGALLTESTNLFHIIKTYIEDTFRHAEANRRRGTALAVSGTVVAALLVGTMIYYFKVWVFTPIRLLQAGVQRVHAGDFDQPIMLNSQDELEELANEFNAMTLRLRAMYTDLAQQVNERSRQLVRSERMVSVGFLAAGVAHEINNPLASIAFCSEALDRRLADMTANMARDDAEVLAKYLKVIQQEAFRCKQITQKLLDFSRSGERTRESTDLGRLVQDVIDVARLLPNHQGKSITFPPIYLVAAVSIPDLKSVVLNLIVNALDSLDTAGTVALSLRSNGTVAELSFRDNGCGMPPDVLEHIFEPFFTRRRTGNGTGLGLSISHQIIDQHGGSIQASSAGLGFGSTFVVRLPINAAEMRSDPLEERHVLPLPQPIHLARAA